MAPQGGAEPCPFSPFSQHNLKAVPITEVLCSAFFRELRDIAANAEQHKGGCVLSDRKEQVQSFIPFILWGCIYPFPYLDHRSRGIVRHIARNPRGRPVLHP